MARGVLAGFGLVSLAVAVPFLWRALAWKRLLAYSSLEHMGVLALGFAFANPLAMAGVVVHVAGHAIAKALGFYAATPLLAHVPGAGRRAGDRGRPHDPVSRGRPGDLAGDARRAAAVTDLRQRGPHRRGRFRRGPDVGGSRAPRSCLRSASSDSGTRSSRRSPGRRAVVRPGTPRGLRMVVALTAVATAALLTLTVLAPWLPGSELVEAMLERRVTGYRDRILEALDSGWSFAGLYAVASGGPVRVVLASDNGELRIESVNPVGGAVPSHRRRRARGELGRAGGS